MKKTVLQLEKLDLSKPNSVLWLGNGINRTFQGDSWEAIIKTEMEKNDIDTNYEDIKNMPANMQIIVATNDNVDKEMKNLSSKINTLCDNEQLMEYMNKYLLNINVSTIITTNYSYEIECAIECDYSFSPMNSSRKTTREVTKTERNSMLFSYNHLKYKEHEKNIWHIHGETCTPTSMIMGNYYYGKLLYRIQDYIGKRMQVLKPAYERKEEVTPQSWIDYFLLCDVYVMGFGMDISEIDFWWLVCCKKRNFPNTKVFVFEANISENIAKQKLLEAYAVSVETDTFEKTNENFKRYYMKCYDELIQKIGSIDR